MINGANGSSLVKRASREPEGVMVNFVAEVMTRLKEEEEPTKEDLLKAFVFASLSLPSESRNAILDHVKSQSDDFLKARKKPKKEEKEETVLPQMMVAHAVRTRGIPAFLEVVVPFAVDFLPGGPMMKRFLVPTLNFSAGFITDLIKEYCANYQRSATPSLMHHLSSGFTLTSSAATSTWQRLGRLIRRKEVPIALRANEHSERSSEQPSVVILTTQPVLILSSSQASSFTDSARAQSSVVVEEINDETDKLKFKI